MSVRVYMRVYIFHFGSSDLPQAIELAGRAAGI